MGVVYTRFHKPRFVNQAGPIELTRFEKTVNGWGFVRGPAPLHVRNIITRRQRNAIVVAPSATLYGRILAKPMTMFISTRTV